MYRVTTNAVPVRVLAIADDRIGKSASSVGAVLHHSQLRLLIPRVSYLARDASMRQVETGEKRNQLSSISAEVLV